MGRHASNEDMARHREMPNEDLGKPIEYDRNFDGPLKNRSCTDVLCLLLFIVFVVAWIGIGFYAYIHGNPKMLLAPRDSQGLRCGIDYEVKNKKYLFFFDLTKCLSPTTPFLGCDTTQVCVETCPSEVFYYVSGTSETSAVLKYCRYNTTIYNANDCPTWYLPSSSIEKRCIPDTSLLNSTQLSDIAAHFSNNTDSFLSMVATAVSNMKLIAEAEQVAEQVIADITRAWWKILIGVGFAVLVCIIYIMMLRWVAGFMVWLSIIGVIAALSAATYFSYTEWQSWKKTYENGDPIARGAKTKRDIFLAIFIITCIVLGIILLMVIFLRKRIILAIALIKEGSKAVSSVTSVLFFPIFPWVLQAGVVAYAIGVGVYLASTGSPLYQIRNLNETCRAESGWTRDSECNPENFTTKNYSSCLNATCRFAQMDNEKVYPYFQGINIFGFFWLAFFVSALGQMILAQVFAQWYWTMHKKTLPFFALTAATYRTIRYHLGTIAFGSLIIAICRMIRVILEYIDRKLKKYDNKLVQAILCCMKCFFWCLEKFLKFINKNAYIMCAIHGKNFCTSAKDAFMLLMRNIVRVFVLDKITDFLFFLSMLLVTVGVGAVSYIFFATDMIPFMDNSRLNYGIVPVIIIMVITFLVASLFFSVYSMAVDTLFLCFLEDSERNNGKDKPYYMSRDLMKILGKKNQRPKKE